MSGALPPGATIGIIGGGQLGRMLAMAAARLGYRTLVLEPQASCPAEQVANRHLVAAYDDADALAELGAAADVITYEFENVPVEALRALPERVAVFPPAAALEASQDRLAEKSFLNGIGISTAPFAPVDNDAGLAAALERFGGSGVLKTRRMGYDGKGQRVFRNAAARDTEGVFDAMGGVPLILEGLVDFDCEISVIAAGGRDGSRAAYDPARNVHRDGILHRSTVPAGVSVRTAASARDAAFAIIDALGYVGVLGVEFFVLGDGAVLVNEIAPRVHNSGHWTEAACVISQFEQHVRAIVGLPLGAGDRHSDCVMENLIGADVERAAALAAEPDVMVHLYGKAETRPGRKMGHFTRLRSRS